LSAFGRNVSDFPREGRVDFLTDGTPLDPAKTYKVVTNNFMATGGDNYAAFKTGTQVFDTNILIRDAIVNYIKAENAAGRPIAPVIDGRATQVK
jgi:2',3'-cyclic-nucleotide 2'-phosphodiesterase (5'-nucleotidase family)